MTTFPTLTPQEAMKQAQQFIARCQPVVCNEIVHWNMTVEMRQDGFTQRWGKNKREVKFHSYKNGHFRFDVWNPAKLSPKQQGVIIRFAREVLDIGADILPHQQLLNELGPWIDVIFALKRGQITMAQFNSITKLNIEVSTWSRYSDHDL